MLLLTEISQLKCAHMGLAVVGVDRDGQAGLRDAGVQDILPSFEDYLQLESHLMRALQRVAAPRRLS